MATMISMKRSSPARDMMLYSLRCATREADKLFSHLSLSSCVALEEVMSLCGASDPSMLSFEAMATLVRASLRPYLVDL